MRHIITDTNEVVIVAIVSFEQQVIRYGVDPLGVVLFALYFFILVLWIFCVSNLVRHVRHL